MNRIITEQQPMIYRSDMESALATISVLPSNRQELDRFKYDIKRDLLAGVVKDPLKVKVKLTILQTLIEELLKDDEVDEVFNKEFELYNGEKKVQIDGATLSQREVGVKYAYEEAGDPNWNFLNTQFSEVQAKKKNREKFLQMLPVEGTVDPETGVYINRPPRTSKTKVVCEIR